MANGGHRCRLPIRLFPAPSRRVPETPPAGFWGTPRKDVLQQNYECDLMSDASHPFRYRQTVLEQILPIFGTQRVPKFVDDLFIHAIATKGFAD